MWIVEGRPSLRAAGRTSGSGDDDKLVTFMGGVELAMVKVYDGAARLLSSDRAKAAGAAFRAHHAAHAAALARVTTRAASGPNQALLANLTPSIQNLRTEQDELQFLGAMEEEVASTYQWMVARLTGTGPIAAAATILPVECQHAVFLGLLQDKPVDGLVPSFQPTTPLLNPADLSG